MNFLMEHEQMDYPGALRWLANKYNIEIKERELSAEEQQAMNDRESMFVINAWARDYFQHVLHNDPDGLAVGMQYFRSRGFRDDIISKFQLGFALTRRDSLAQKAKKEGYKEEYLIKTGLCYKKDNGELVDRFAGRVIFPWISISGKVNAFGGRLLDSRTKGVQQKYVNSPESDIYHKDHELYGLFQAKRAIAKEDKVYMVEGYTDVISMHQNGIENVVANSGTALSVHQVNLLRRFTQNITLLYDGDEAGIHAALRGTDMMLQGGMNVKVLLLPDGDDPDSFAQSHSTAEVEKYIADNETDFIRFKTAILLKDAADDPIRRADVINDVLRSVAAIDDLVKRQVYLAECARNFGVSEESLGLQLARIKAGKAEDVEKKAMRQRAAQSLEAQPAQAEKAEGAGSEANALAFLYSYELRLLRYVVKYALCELCDAEDEDGNLVPMSVLDFVTTEMQRDAIEFRNPICSRVMDMIRESAGQWPAYREERIRQLKDESAARMAEAISALRNEDLSVSAINAREAQIKAECEAFVAQETDMAAEDFVSRTLCSSPDDEVRVLATNLTIDKYQLSKVHTKHNKVESEREGLIRLVPRALSELKSAVLEVEIRTLQARLDANGSSADDLRELMRLNELRKEFARCLGERTITPHKI